MKNKLLYVSPFWPCKTGISEYSEALIEGLAQHFEITLLTDGYTPSDEAVIKKYKIVCDYNQIDMTSFKHILYNFGNNPEFHSYMYDMILKYPGYIVLHDYVLYYLTVGYYMQRNKLYQKMYEMEGVRGINTAKRSLKKNPEKNLLAHKNISAQLPMNKEIINAAKGIFVHSNYSKQKILEQYPDKKAYEIPHLKTLLARGKDEEQKDFLRHKFNLKDNQYIIGSIGIIAPSKQNELVCQAVKQYNDSHEDKVVYIMCGAGDYVDAYLDEYIYKTGFLENEEFFKAIKSCDLIVNLRYPYNGEASGTLIQCMDMKKPCIATEIGWFGELPDDVIVKVPIEITVSELSDIIEEIKRDKNCAMAERAHEYVAQKCSAEYVAEQIYNAMCEKK